MSDKYQTAIKAINEAYTHLPEKMASKDATVFLLAIGLEESNLEHRWQVVNPRKPSAMGPARSFWQFEVGGLRGVFNHRSSGAHARLVARDYSVKGEAQDVHAVMHLAKFDGLSAAMARLLCWTDPKPVPKNAEQALDRYLWLWRPGAYSRGTDKQKRAIQSKFIAHYNDALKHV